MLIGPFVAISWAAEPTEVTASEEIVVWGRRVEEARQAVVGRLEGLGYHAVRDGEGRTVFKHPAGWKGKVLLYDDGYLMVRRRGPFLREPPEFPGTDVPAFPLCIVMPTACIGAGSWYLSDRRWDGVETRVADATTRELGVLGDALADRSVARTLEELPAALEGCWIEGRPLVSELPLQTMEERRAELLRFWDTRTENAWGAQVRAVTASFVRAVVQQSDAAYTPEEIARFEARRQSNEPFPWIVDIDGGVD